MIFLISAVCVAIVVGYFLAAWVCGAVIACIFPAAVATKIATKNRETP